MLVFRLAIRNIFRNKRRTLLTLLAIMFGCVALTMYGGYVNYVFVKMRESTIHSQYGHIQIYKEGFTQHGPADPAKYTFTEEQYGRILKVIEEDKRIDFATPRLPFAGLISNGPTTLTLLATGVDPIREAKLGQAVAIIKGDNLSAKGQGEILIGEGLRGALQAKIDDNLTILGNTFDGVMNGLNVTVKGVFSTGVEAYDDSAGQMSLASAQFFLNTKNVQAVVVILHKTADTLAVDKSLREKLAGAGVSIEMKTWEDLATFYKKVKYQLETQFKFIKIIIAVIVVLGIANTMVMSVYERVREVGTLMAIGTRRSKILWMFLGEGLALGVLGGALGLIVAVIGKVIIDQVGGIPMPPPPGYTESYPAFIYLVPSVMAFAFVTSVCTALISSLYPAYRASRLEVVDALRHV